jgi:hypothetical protein
MQWAAILIAIFLVFGLRRSRSRRSLVTMAVLVAATLAVWYSQMTTHTA